MREGGAGEAGERFRTGMEWRAARGWSFVASSVSAFPSSVRRGLTFFSFLGVSVLV